MTGWRYASFAAAREADLQAAGWEILGPLDKGDLRYGPRSQRHKKLRARRPVVSWQDEPEDAFLPNGATAADAPLAMLSAAFWGDAMSERKSAKNGELSIYQLDEYRYALALDGLVIYAGPEAECMRRAELRAEASEQAARFQQTRDQWAAHATGL